MPQIRILVGARSAAIAGAACLSSFSASSIASVRFTFHLVDVEMAPRAPRIDRRPVAEVSATVASHRYGRACECQTLDRGAEQGTPMPLENPLRARLLADLSSCRSDRSRRRCSSREEMPGERGRDGLSNSTGHPWQWARNLEFTAGYRAPTTAAHGQLGMRRSPRPSASAPRARRRGPRVRI
jgi:hypothetical protein